MKLKLTIVLTFMTLMLFGQTRQKVIFDCDLGDDIDDAFALAMLLTNQDKLDILGITTCYGRTNDRAKVALKMLYETGQDKIPVALGRNTSNTDARANWYAEQFYWAKDFNKLKPIQQSATDFIIENLRKYPNEVIIISVGPVTNMADVIDKDPQALKLAKKVYAMFGSFYIGYNTHPSIDAEWNVKVDIPASKKFVNSGANIVYAGLDVTAMVKLDKVKRDILLMRQSVLTNALSGLYVLWGNETPTLFDPVAIGMILYPELFKTKKINISVDDKGFTRVNENQVPNAEVGVSIDSNEFVNRIMKSYLFQNLER
ncbi:nucleoside hydrolase [Flectobacillus sp. DC10W]|uniref:Nucleoside hydrolase n=1 Tax=Flectobacillus longus TaxID=2984207 RepID=A0ABT6YPL6_9BACT|nr:nucleoside hydrolase [Flectobacillus longus]MDI9865538.1 nucleoside hydrolase [Flectobacillus longus]